MNKFFIQLAVLGLLLCTILKEPRQVMEDFTSYGVSTLFKHNLHSVVPGRFYRSKQMDGPHLTETIRNLKIKTVIDLRLGGDDDREGEPEIVRAAGAKYVHVPFRGSRTDQRDAIKQLKAEYAMAEEPILVHCSSGTHRSGVASAVWLLENGYGAERAADQLSVRYGYLAVERFFKAIVEGKPLFGQLIPFYYQAYKEGGCSFDSWLDAGVGSDASKWKCPKTEPDGVAVPISHSADR